MSCTSENFLDGCLLQTEDDERLLSEMESRSISLPTIYKVGEMPVIRWDDTWEDFIDRRGDNIEIMMEEKSRCVFPWVVFDSLPETKTLVKGLYYSQGDRPSCMGHADDFAYRSGVLSSIALGAPLVYSETNPYLLWRLSKNRSERGGQSVAKMAKAANEIGHFSVAQAGKDNTNVSNDFIANEDEPRKMALKHQSAVVWLQSKTAAGIADQIMRCARAGFGVALGNGTAVKGSTIDKNNVQIAVLGGSWSHATSFTTWMKRKGSEYVFWANSHGKLYKKATFKEPFDGCWMTREILERFLAASFDYGMPYCVVPETVFTEVRNLMFDFQIPFPPNF